MTAPVKIKCVSDSNELELVKIIPKDKILTDTFLDYTYIKSNTKMGTNILFSERELEKQLKNNIFEII